MKNSLDISELFTRIEALPDKTAWSFVWHKNSQTVSLYVRDVEGR